MIDSVKEWLDANWDTERRSPKAGDIRSWYEHVFRAGWAVPSWPREWWGLGLDAERSGAIRRAFKEVGAPGAGQDRTNIPAATVMAFGSEDLRRSVVPGFLSHSLRQCLLYSEPEAGSDLAAVRTRADHRSEGYVIQGHKLWTSGAAQADFGLLLARTDWSRPKHAGLSYFLLDMHQPGIDVRPLRQITGESLFNEVFIDGARIPVSHRLGAEGEGWKILQYALTIERRLMAEGVGESRKGETRARGNPVLDAVRAAGRLEDPLIQDDLARVLAWRKLNSLNERRARVGNAPQLAALGKLAMSRVLHQEARLLRKLLGSASLLDGSQFPAASHAHYLAANAYMTSIGGGTDQIQRNIIAERLLEMPREEDVSRDRPFGSVSGDQ
ncbi:acyl-CoA dehydrogenase family protein [Altererythrobacter sp. Z27]|uniref:acyl-CoA dehydrogenase family protein n=1 Tax=Altererythrobacter sp. Z27 TaxID=3461147 RepID=UPI004044EABC